MAGFNEYPYRDWSGYNLDWLLHHMKELGLGFDAFVQSNIVKYHDPIYWNITEQYEANTIVRNGLRAYLSKKPVPAGVAITNTDYWFLVGDSEAFIEEMDRIRHQISAHEEGTNAESSINYHTGSLFWLNGYLCEALQNIGQGAAFIRTDNYERVTVESLLRRRQEYEEETRDDLEALEGSVTSLAGRVSTAETAISQHNTRITDNTNDITALDGRMDTVESTLVTHRADINRNTWRGFRKRIIAIGDSIALGHNPDGDVTGWIEQLRILSGRTTGTSFFSAARGGSGFVKPSATGNDTFLTLLQSLEGNVGDADTISDIYVIGGTNDSVYAGATYANMKQAVKDFCYYARQTYPNARVHVGCIAYFKTGNYNISSALRDTHRAYRDGCSYKATYLDGIVSAMCRMSDYASDGIHVNAAATLRIAEAAMSECGAKFSAQIAGTANAEWSRLPVLNGYVDGNYIHVFCIKDTLTITGNTLHCNGTLTDMGALTESTILGVASGDAARNWQMIPFNCSVRIVGSSNYIPGSGYFSVYNGHLWIAVNATPPSGGYAGYADAIIIMPINCTIPIV